MKDQIQVLEQLMQEARLHGDTPQQKHELAANVVEIYIAACSEMRAKTGSLKTVNQPNYGRLMTERIEYAENKCREYLGRS